MADSVAGRRDYAQESAAVLRADATQQVEDIRQQLQSLTSDVMHRGVFSDGLGAQTRFDFQVAPDYKEFNEEIQALATSAREGTPDILAFRNVVAKRMEADPALSETGRHLLEITTEAGKVALPQATPHHARPQRGSERRPQPAALLCR